MGRFTVIPLDTFEGMQTDAGVLLKNFDPEHPESFSKEDVICATTGGINVTCKPTYSDMGEDVDNCPNGVKELMRLDGWNTSVSTTSLGTTAEAIRMALGAADINATEGKIVPRRDLKQGDFADVWWVGDKANGGWVAVRVINALATEGFDLKTTKNKKGTISLTLTGHPSILTQEQVPMEFYTADPEPAGGTPGGGTPGGEP